MSETLYGGPEAEGALDAQIDAMRAACPAGWTVNVDPKAGTFGWIECRGTDWCVQVATPSTAGEHWLSSVNDRLTGTPRYLSVNAQGLVPTREDAIRDGMASLVPLRAALAALVALLPPEALS